MRRALLVSTLMMAALVGASCQGSSTPSSAADSGAAAIPGVHELKAGDVAPDFSLPGTDGRTYRLADYKGKQAVVLAWFAKAFTGP